MQREFCLRRATIPKRLLLEYLQSVVADDPETPDDKAVGVPHSDRHLVLLAHLQHLEGDDSSHVRQQIRQAIAVEAVRVGALARVIAVLAAANIPSLILKGAALSYTVYPAPHLRPRNDDDLWVREADFTRACAVVQAHGYQPEVEVTAADITRQRHFHATGGSMVHKIDLHWWPVNPSAFDHLPPFDACFAESVPLAAVGPHARAPGPVHGLVLACAHRVAHHTQTEDAMWLCDLHFVADSLTAIDWATVEATAHASQVARLTGTELARVRTTLDTPVPSPVIDRLSAVRGELSAHYLRPLGPLRDLWFELRARPDWSTRARLLGSHLLPPREYVAARYGYQGAVLLPFFYAHRAVRGLAHWTAQFFARLAG